MTTREEQQVRYWPVDFRACVLCGCSDNRACPGGCSWATTTAAHGVDLCSRCAEVLKAALAIAEASP